MDDKSELKNFVASPLSRSTSRALSPPSGGSPSPIPVRRPSRRPTAVPDALKQAAVAVARREDESDSGTMNASKELTTEIRPDTDVPPAVQTLPAETSTVEAPVKNLSFFSLAELKAGVPPGVDPREKEKYLSDEEFNSVFRMSKAAFSALPKWKQTTLKKDNRLY